MSEVLVELVSLRKKLEACDQDNTEQLLRYLSRLGELSITKKDIRSSKINEILRLMSKNSNDTFDRAITRQAKRVRESWKQQLTLQKSGALRKEKMERVAKAQRDAPDAPANKPEPVPPPVRVEPAPKQSLYDNEVFLYYDELENKFRKRFLTMLVKIFGKLGDILARVFKDRIGLGQPAFCPHMKFEFSDFFLKRHKDSLLADKE